MTMLAVNGGLTLANIGTFAAIIMAAIAIIGQSWNNMRRIEAVFQQATEEAASRTDAVVAAAKAAVDNAAVLAQKTIVEASIIAQRAVDVSAASAAQAVKVAAEAAADAVKIAAEAARLTLAASNQGLVDAFQRHADDDERHFGELRGAVSRLALAIPPPAPPGTVVTTVVPGATPPPVTSVS
jgi:hypothetical protein